MGQTLAATPNIVYNTSEGAKFNASSTLIVVTCATCGIPYAIPEPLQRSARKYHGDTTNGWKLCCPLGHQWWYTGETEKERLQRLLKDEREWAARLAADRDQARADARAQKAAKTRFKNERDRTRRRIAHGVCPCCGRTFKQLSRHMASQHPGYVAGANDPTDPVDSA